MWISIQYHLQNYSFSSNPTIKELRIIEFVKLKMRMRVASMSFSIPGATLRQ